MMPDLPNPPVRQILLWMPPETRERLTPRLWAVFRERRRVPACRTVDSPADILRALCQRTVRTGVLTAGPDGAAGAAAVTKALPALKILRVLEPGAAEPPPVFSYRHIAVGWPDTAADFRFMADWFGITEYLPRGWPEFDDTERPIAAKKQHMEDTL